jgi:hypothetical protein
MAIMNAFPERSVPAPRTFRVRIIARDPSILDPRSADPARRILRADVDVPWSRLQPGPWGPRFHVVDFDATTDTLTPAADLLAVAEDDLGRRIDAFAAMSDAELLDSAGFRAQSVYAIAARTLARFEAGLGRPVPWAFGSSTLYLVPSAFAEANAYYADVDQALYFGYFPGTGRRRVYTCLAHDIVVHETTHAILDGLRRRFDVPGFADQAGFHEAFADIVALLSLLELQEVLEVLLGDGQSGDQPERLTADKVSEDALRDSVLFTIGREFGDAVYRTRGGGLRRSVRLKPTKAWLDDDNPEWAEPHRRGEILVAAVMHAFLRIWVARLAPILETTIDRRRAAEEGATAARHLLQMVIRGIDYCPPVDFTFGDFLAAVIAADEEVAPNDDLHYRDALRAAFDAFGISAPAPLPFAITTANAPTYRAFSYAALRSDPDEAFRFLWDNAALLGIAGDYYLHVENVRPSVRVGPRGFVVSESLVDYVQELIVTRSELDTLAAKVDSALRAPADIPGDTQLKLFGGGTIVFDEFGAIKYHHVKPLTDWGRQMRRLQYLVTSGQWDTKGRIGFSTGDSPGQKYAAFHTSGEHSDEEW